jgi:hypothetical protein
LCRQAKATTTTLTVLKGEKGMSNERTIHFIGAGGVGFWTLVALSRSGLQGLKVYDDDDLQGGLGATRLPQATATTKKVNLLTGFIRVSMGGEPPVVLDRRFKGTEVRRNDLVVDCSDMDGNTRRAIYEQVVQRGGRYIRVSYDGANSTVVMAEGLPITGDEAAAGYASVPSLALSLAAGGIAGEVLMRLMNSTDPVDHIEFQISLADYVVARAAA